MPLKRLYRMQRKRLAAAPMRLQPQLGWRARLVRGFLFLVLAIGLLGAGGWLGWSKSLGLHQASLSGQTARVEQLDRLLASEVAMRHQLEQQLKVERATREALALDLSRTQAELSSKQEALAFFDSLLTSNDRSRAVRFVACELQLLEGRQYRYRALLAQGQTSATELDGRLLVIVDYQRRGQRSRIALGQDKPIAVQIKHFLRSEGGVSLPADAVPLSVEIRLMNGEGHQQIAQCQKKVGGV